MGKREGETNRETEIDTQAKKKELFALAKRWRGRKDYSKISKIAIKLWKFLLVAISLLTLHRTLRRNRILFNRKQCAEIKRMCI